MKGFFYTTKYHKFHYALDTGEVYAYFRWGDGRAEEEPEEVYKAEEPMSMDEFIRVCDVWEYKYNK